MPVVSPALEMTQVGGRSPRMSVVAVRAEVSVQPADVEEHRPETEQ